MIFGKIILVDACLCKNIIGGLNMLDAETKVTKRFRNPRARGCNVLSKARALLRAQGFLNHLVTVGQGA